MRCLIWGVIVLVSLTYNLFAQNVIPVAEHIVIVVLENQSKRHITGNENAPFLNSLLNDSNCAFFSRSFGVTHPSQPNYLMLFSGSRQHVYNDSALQQLPLTTPNLASALLEKGLSFAGYAEDLPFPGYSGNHTGKYAKRHCPWVNWQNSQENRIPEKCNLPFSEFPEDFNLLPTVSFVIPNLDHDMHDPPNIAVAIKEGDDWLKKNIEGYLLWAETHNSLLIITFDEDDNHHKNNIPTWIIGQKVKGRQYSEFINHYSVLRMLEEMFHLPIMGKTNSAKPITEIWRHD